MSAFWIFAAILTAAYAIYYAVIISIDLYGKKDNPNETSVETFEIGDTPPETSKAVEVTEGGFRVGGSQESEGSPQWTETKLKTTPQSESTDSTPPPKLDATGAKITPAQEKIQATQKEMEEISPEMNSEMTLQIAKSVLEQGGHSVDINKSAAKPDKNEPSTEENYEENAEKNSGKSRDHI